MPDETDKLKVLQADLARRGRVAVAFSGGVDSSFLLAAARDALGAENVLAVTVKSVLAPAFELRDAEWFCKDVGVHHVVVEADPLAIDGVRANGPDRCYHCKREIFSLAKAAAAREGFDVLADGSNLDDDGDFRPGTKAARELGVASPLRDAGMAKRDVRELSRQMGLPTWDAPSCACLATRVAYGDALDAETLARIDAAEDYLRGLEFEQVRVRVHGDVARIEVGGAQIARLAEPTARIDVAAKLRSLGFTYICADLEGFRSGSMNESNEGGACVQRP